jgi:hypothetical protein
LGGEGEEIRKKRKNILITLLPGKGHADVVGERHNGDQGEEEEYYGVDW